MTHVIQSLLVVQSDPFLSVLLSMILGCVGLLILVRIGLIHLVHTRRKVEIHEVPEGVAAWTVSRANLWVKFYYSFWCSYPHDICSYFWKSVLLVVLSVVGSLAAGSVLICAANLLFWIFYATYLLLKILIVETPTGISAMPAALTATWEWLIMLVIPLKYWIMVGSFFATICIVRFSHRFFHSNSWKVTCLRIKAWKERTCYLIRVVD